MISAKSGIMCIYYAIYNRYICNIELIQAVQIRNKIKAYTDLGTAFT